MEQNYEIMLATEADRSEIRELYEAQKGREHCSWNENYPSDETIDFDLKRNALYVLKDGGKLKAAISLEEDDDVDRLTCWDDSLRPEGELARVAVRPEEQGKGLGRIIFGFAMEELKKRGFKGLHILVNKNNMKAIRCYAVFGFRNVGECHMYDQDFLCYERKL